MQVIKGILEKFKKRDGIVIVSLFDGIATGYYAAEKAGLKISKYYSYEIDKHAITVAQKNYPDIIQKGDVIGADFSEFCGKVDLLIGGSPCQNLSIAGDRTGLKGEKSKLFFEFVRALEEIKPKYFLLENNASMDDTNKAAISKYMGVDPVLINSADFSAQNRKRLYWTNITIPPIQDKGIELQDILEYGVAERHKSKTVRIGGGVVVGKTGMSGICQTRIDDIQRLNLNACKHYPTVTPRAYPKANAVKLLVMVGRLK